MVGLIYVSIQKIPGSPEEKIPYLLVGIVSILVAGLCIYNIIKILETFYSRYYKKPFYIHFYISKKKLSPVSKAILETYPFYNQIDSKEKKYFEHRVVRFLETTDFRGRDGLVLDDNKRLQIAMMVIQMTFGMRNYLLESVETIILYPSSYYSILNKSENNGEFNPRSKALVLSWEHFNANNHSGNDGINLGIHEITHAIHYHAMKSNDISAEIFHETFLELEKYLSSVELRKRIVNSKILREYAFTDKFEFIAVLVEVFMETPEDLKKQFPDIYQYVAQMLNFRYFETS